MGSVEPAVNEINRVRFEFQFKWLTIDLMKLLRFMFGSEVDSVESTLSEVNCVRFEFQLEPLNVHFSRSGRQ